MATVSSHILDSISGRSAAGIHCQLFARDEQDIARLIFDVEADREGRIAEEVGIGETGATEFELVFHGAAYFAAQRRLPSRRCDNLGDMVAALQTKRRACYARTRLPGSRHGRGSRLWRRPQPVRRCH